MKLAPTGASNVAVTLQYMTATCKRSVPFVEKSENHRVCCLLLCFTNF
jgi:hypothetical protein